MVSYPTLCEAYSLVLYKLGIGNAHSWLREVQSYATLINPTSPKTTGRHWAGFSTTGIRD
jgi:hypothetical protein